MSFGIKRLNPKKEAMLRNMGSVPALPELSLRVKRSNLAFSEEIATVENDLAMTDAIDTCNSYRWIWVDITLLWFSEGIVP